MSALILHATDALSDRIDLVRGQNLKYRPYVFAEYGAIMAPSVLNSPPAKDVPP